MNGNLFLQNILAPVAISNAEVNGSQLQESSALSSDASVAGDTGTSSSLHFVLVHNGCCGKTSFIEGKRREVGLCCSWCLRGSIFESRLGGFGGRGVEDRDRRV